MNLLKFLFQGLLILIFAACPVEVEISIICRRLNELLLELYTGSLGPTKAKFLTCAYKVDWMMTVLLILNFLKSKLALGSKWHSSKHPSNVYWPMLCSCMWSSVLPWRFCLCNLFIGGVFKMFALAQGLSSAPEERGHWPVLQLRCSAAAFGNPTYFPPLLTVFNLIRGACYSVSNPLFLAWTSVCVSIWPIRLIGPTSVFLKQPSGFNSGWLSSRRRTGSRWIFTISMNT